MSARLADEYEDATLTIVGIGEMEQALRARIAELHLEGRVTLTGGLPHEEVLRRMDARNILLVPCQFSAVRASSAMVRHRVS